MTRFGPHGRHAHPDGHLTPAEIRDHQLPDAAWGRRGYAKVAVRRLLATVAEQVHAMRAEIDAVWRTVDRREQEIEQRRYGIGLPAHRPEAGPDDLQLRWQIEAQRYSDDITATAQRQAADIVGEAQQQADQVRAEFDADGYHQATTELVHLRRTVAALQRWVGEMRRQVDATDDALTAEFGLYAGGPDRAPMGPPPSGA